VVRGKEGGGGGIYLVAVIVVQVLENDALERIKGHITVNLQHGTRGKTRERCRKKQSVKTNHERTFKRHYSRLLLETRLQSGLECLPHAYGQACRACWAARQRR
jgi:hypothetical protein